MKTLVKIFFLGVLTVLLSYAAMAKDISGKDPINGKDKNLYVIKTDKKFVGAKVEIVQANGTVIAEQILQRRKMIVDFDDMKMGSYTIRIKKGDEVKEMTFTKK